MTRFADWMRWLALGLLVAEGAGATQVQLAPGNGVWIKPLTTTVIGNEAAVIANLKSRNLAHVFLWTTDYSAADYVPFGTFIQQAHSNGMTVHGVCAVESTIDVGGSPSPVLLSNLLYQVVSYNTSHPAATLDGVQIDVEGVTGAQLLALVSAVHVPETLVFSAAVQPDEFEGSQTIESVYGSLLQNTDMDLLIPMIYIMDGIGYRSGTNVYTFTVPGIATKTAQLLALLPAQGRMMTGLSGYDYEYAVTKGAGRDTAYRCNGSSQMAFGTGSCAVPQLLGDYPLYDVTYQANGGLSVYRFDADSTHWMDVLEMTPIGLRRSIAAADQGGSGNPRYVGTCMWLYSTVFDATSGRQEGFTPDDNIHPSPSVRVDVLGVSAGQARLRVTLTNMYPSEKVLGAHSAAGVHLRLEGASFISADAGTFHAAEAFGPSGNLLANIGGAQIVELRRGFFENPSSPNAQSGEITVSALGTFTLRYRAWMMDKDSICNDVGTSEPYVSRSPDDVHYSDAAKFLTYATFATNITVIAPASYVAAVMADKPVTYHRFCESNVVPRLEAFTLKNLGSLGVAGNGAVAATNYGFSTSILGAQPGALATGTNTALKFPGNGDTNRVLVPYQTEWNLNAPFSIELWLKGGTTFSCPANSVDFNRRGWLVYQGNSDQNSGSGWWFRIYNTISNQVNAQVNMTVSSSAWYHIVGVYDGTKVLLYTNGALAASTTVSGAYAPNTNAAYPLTFGARSDDGKYPYGGLVDEPAFYTNALSLSQIAAHYKAATTNAAGYAPQILAHSPAGYWRFDESLLPPEAANSGSTGAANDGVYLNWSTTIPELQSSICPGLEATNRVLQLFGTNGQVMIPALNLDTNTVTFECMVKRDGAQQSYAGLIMHRNADGGGGSACGLAFRGVNSHLGYNWNDVSGTYTWDSGLTPPDGQWAYVAVAVSPSQAVICLCDGSTWRVATHSGSHAVQAFAGLTRVGTDGGTNRWYKGMIDEVAIYDTALTQAQLRTHALAAFGHTNQPVFTQWPLSQTVELGAPATFSALAIGAPTILYQWQKDGVPIADATNTSYSLPSAYYTNSGQYRLVAVNDYGQVPSPAGALVVFPPASVSNLTYRTFSTPAGVTLELIWPDGILYSADDLGGPWLAVTNAAAPYYAVPIDQGSGRRFFRAQ